MASLPYPRHPPRGCSCPSCTNQANSAYPPTEFTEFTETTGEEYSPTDFTDAHRWLGCVRSSHRIRRTHRNDCRKYSPTDFTDAHRFLGCVRFCGFCGKIVWCLRGYGILPYPRRPLKSSHRIHGFHRNEWRRRASPGFHRCSQMVRLRKVLWLLWEDSLVPAWVWQGCHTLLICAHPCNLWEFS